MAGKTFGQARQVVLQLAKGAPVLCIVKTERQRTLMRLLIEELLSEQKIRRGAH